MDRPKNLIEGRINKTLMIFVAQYINTSVVIILCYSSFIATTERIKNNYARDLFVGSFDEFNIRWYQVIGTPLVLTILV
jgi:hypothetical protein